MKTIDVYVVYQEYTGVLVDVYGTREEAEQNAEEFDVISVSTLNIPEDISVQADY